MTGFIFLHREIKHWEWYDEPNTFRLFMHLLLSVNYEDKKWRGKVIKKGQMITSLGKLSEQTGLSVQQVRTALKNLESTHEITHEGNRNYSTISILKWDDYQQNNTQPTHEITQSQQSDNKQITTTKEINNKINNNNPPISPQKPTKVSLEELSIDHIDDWLNQKRVHGKYLQIDEHRLLEKFKDFCISTGRDKGQKAYKDYVAAFRNSFEWDNAPRKGKGNETNRYGNRQSNSERADDALAEHLANIRAEVGLDGEEEQHSADCSSELRHFSHLRENPRAIQNNPDGFRQSIVGVYNPEDPVSV
jgi:hypothetical protein